MDGYSGFLASKAVRVSEAGIEPPQLADHLFSFQRVAVEHALRTGRAGNFLDTGLGKTECQLEWCKHAMAATNGMALILTPLAVAGQTKRRADRWGYDARVIRTQADAGPGINICNYERLHNLDSAAFGAVCLDEGSILKSFTGKTRNVLVGAFAGTRFKLVATATPAPNDHMELGNYAEFLEIMATNEMLSRWFINDTSTASQQWRLKGHAERDFWDWMASWSRMATLPSDLGGDDDGFVLSPFTVRKHTARETEIRGLSDGLFAEAVMSATTMHDVKRQTSEARADAVASLVPGDEPFLIWCDTDYEADAIKRAVPNAAEVRGSMSVDQKEEVLDAFGTGQINTLIAKPSMCGFGLDWSHCARMAFVGRSYSYETYYQAVRRCWRFGQKRPVVVDLIVAEGENTISRAIDRKRESHDRMRAEMRAAMQRATGATTSRRVTYNPTHKGSLPRWISAA